MLFEYTCSVSLQEEGIAIVPEVHPSLRQLVDGCHLLPQTTENVSNNKGDDSIMATLMLLFLLFLTGIVTQKMKL